MKGNKTIVPAFIILIVFISYTIVLFRQDYNNSVLEKSNQHLVLENERLEKQLKVSNSNYQYILDMYDEQTETYEGIFTKIEEQNDKDISYYKKKLKSSKTFHYSKEEITLLAKCVQAEAGHYKQHSISQKMVAKVILNRVNSPDFPDTIKGVIYQKNRGIPQFSTAYDGAIDKQVLTPETIANVYEVLLFGYDLPVDVQYFYSTHLSEGNWIRKLKVYDTVQGTVFAYNERR